MMNLQLIDLHSHLLPGVDDGCRTFAEALGHLERFARQGVTSLALTPHLMLGRGLSEADITSVLASQRRAFDALWVRRDFIDACPDLILGQELRLRTGEEAAQVANRMDVGLGRSDLLLVEFGFSADFDALAVLDCLGSAGRTVIVAHPERYSFSSVDAGIRAVDEWKRRGAIIQLSGGSVLGLYTPAAERLARRLLREGLADHVSTDHHGDTRPHDPALLFGALANFLGLRAAEELMQEAPRRLLYSITPIPETRLGSPVSPDGVDRFDVLTRFGHWTPRNPGLAKFSGPLHHM